MVVGGAAVAEVGLLLSEEWKELSVFFLFFSFVLSQYCFVFFIAEKRLRL